MRTLSIGIILAMAGLYALPGLAQESGDGTASSVFSDGTGKNPAVSGNTHIVTKDKNADIPVANEAPADSEAAGPMSATDKIVARFMALDTDTSGGVSFDEYMTMVQQRAKTRYAAMDTNNDGEVTDEEYRTFWKLRMAQWYRLKR